MIGILHTGVIFEAHVEDAIKVRAPVSSFRVPLLGTLVRNRLRRASAVLIELDDDSNGLCDTSTYPLGCICKGV